MPHPQKIHACTAPHDPSVHVNDRVRDVADLLLIHDSFYQARVDLHDLKNACRRHFESRAGKACHLARTPRVWPPEVKIPTQRRGEWNALATSVGISSDIDAAVTDVNAWVAEIAAIRD
ncbi:MAG: hypothetical protein ACRD0P_07145 [Stackebrandtia sp.]